MGKHWYLIIISLALIVISTHAASSQKRYGAGYYNSHCEVINGDTIDVINLVPVYVFRRPADMRKHARLVRNVKKVYPIAQEAKAKLEKMEAHIQTISNPREQQQYIRRVEKEIIREYTPVLREMTFSQGKVLIKLIDRQTSKTSYELVKELRGGFTAGLWQGVARIFGANLKDSYDKDGEDKIIEQIIILYEAGLI